MTVSSTARFKLCVGRQEELVALVRAMVRHALEPWWHRQRSRSGAVLEPFLCCVGAPCHRHDFPKECWPCAQILSNWVYPTYILY